MSSIGNKKIMAENIQYFMDKNKVDRRKLSKELDIPYTTLCDWLKAKTYPRIDKIEMMANYFQIEKSDLVEKKTEHKSEFSFSNIVPIQPKKLKVIGSIAAGSPIFAEEEYDVYVTPGEEVKCDYGLRVKGDSMIDDRINDGDLVFIKQQEMVENGQIAAVIIDDCATLKHFYYYPETDLVILKPANKNYEDMIFQGDQISNIRVLGKAVGFTSKL